MSKHVSFLGLISLLTVWIVWGSTYLGIRMAVREGAGIPPFTMAAGRTIVGGVVLLLFAAACRQRIRPTREEWITLAISAALLLVGGNGLVTWAEQRAHSGYAALCVGSTPIFSSIVESILLKRRPSLRLILSLLVGFAGLTALTAPELLTGTRADMWATAALIMAPLSWSIGSSLQQRRKVGLHPAASSGWQQVLGLVGFLLLVLVRNEPPPSPSPTAWWAWAYLSVAGSVFGFTAFVVALKHLPMPVVMTYAYVNPLIAVALGWLFLREPVTVWTLTGTALILAGVAGVFHEKFAAMRKS